MNSPSPPDDRLDSWKEIAGYLKRDVTTVQRWEKREGMPVHRHVHDKIGSVYAFRSELNAWSLSRNLGLAAENVPAVEDIQVPAAQAAPAAPAAVGTEPPRWWLGLWLLAATGALAAAGFMFWQLRETNNASVNPLAEARFLQMTDFPGTEQAAALSRDGRFAAFLSDRDGRMDVWVTQVGHRPVLQPHSRIAARELVNPSVRTLGFSPDGTLVTFWARSCRRRQPIDISVWGVPVLGGQPRPYLDGVAEYDWSSDGARLVYHTPGPAIPMFVRDSAERSATRRADLHSAAGPAQSLSPSGRRIDAFIYFVQGSVPDRMDIWRIRRNRRSA